MFTYRNWQRMLLRGLKMWLSKKTRSVDYMAMEHVNVEGTEEFVGLTLGWQESPLSQGNLLGSHRHAGAAWVGKTLTGIYKERKSERRVFWSLGPWRRVFAMCRVPHLTVPDLTFLLLVPPPAVPHPVS